MQNWVEVDELEDQQNWIKVREILLTRWNNGERDLNTLIRLGFFCWYLVVEWDCINTDGLSDDDYRMLESILLKVTEFGIEYFNNEPEFLWIFGYMSSLFPMHFGDYDEWLQRGSDMIAKAHRLKPEDLIIELLYLNGKPKDKYKRVCNQASELLQDRFPGIGMMDDYFRSVLCRSGR